MATTTHIQSMEQIIQPKGKLNANYDNVINKFIILSTESIIGFDIIIDAT